MTKSEHGALKLLEAQANDASNAVCAAEIHLRKVRKHYSWAERIYVETSERFGHDPMAEVGLR